MDQKDEKRNDETWQKRQLVLALIATALLALMVGTLAWLNYVRALQTATVVDMPSLIIRGPLGSDSEPIRLGDIDVTAGTSYECVFSVHASKATAYKLQLAHTTNIPFTYEIFHAEDPVETEPSSGSYAKENQYYYSYSTPLGGSYINLDSVNNHSYLADNSLHSKSYGSYEFVQINAEPLYWQSVSVPVEGEGLDYYVLVVSWEEGLTNNKETDIVYLTVETALD